MASLSAASRPAGARHLFAGLSVADGQVYGTCRNRKCFVDFQAFVQQIIVPQALHRKVHTVALILDNGTTHASKQLVKVEEGFMKQSSVSSSCSLHERNFSPLSYVIITISHFLSLV